MSGVEVKGLAEVNRKISMMRRMLPQEAVSGLFDVALEIRNNAIIGMQNTVKRADRIYTRRSIRHRPSAPGWPPAIDTGGLVGSIVPDIQPSGEEVIVGSVIKEPNYAEWMEIGTPGGKIAPRPWLDPAIKTVEDDIENGVLRKIIEGIEKL